MTPFERALSNSILRCPVCGRERTVSPDQAREYITHGWPKCCGEIMQMIKEGGVNRHE